MFGFNSDKVAQGEIDSGGLNSRGKMTEWDFGDDFRAGFYGLFNKDYSRETLEKKAREKQTESYNDSGKISGLNTELAQYRPGTVITRKPGESLSDMQARGNNELGLGKRISEAKLTNPNADLSGVNTIQDLTAAVGKDNESKKNDVGGVNYLERIRKDEQKYRRQKEEQARLDRLSADARAALTRSQERTQDLELRRDNMSLEYARMARQDRNDMKDRKDKNIMMLMQGLAGIATGFTV